MKSCPKCNTPYPDTENYCMECGTALVGKPRRVRPTRIVVKTPKTEPRLKAKINKLENELKRVRKDTVRVDMIKHLPKEKVTSLLNDFDKIERKVRGLTEFIKENEKTLDDIERSLRDVVKKTDLMELSKRVEDHDKTLSHFTKRGESLDEFKDKMVLITGLALQQQTKLKKMRNRLKTTFKSKMDEITEKNDLLSKKMEAGFDKATADVFEGLSDLKSRLDDNLQSLNDKISEMEKEISARIISLRERSASKAETRNLKEEFGTEKSKLVDIMDQLIDQDKVLGELEGVKENLVAEQKQRIREFGTGLRNEFSIMKKEHEEAMSSLRELESRFKASATKMKSDMENEKRNTEETMTNITAMSDEFRRIATDSQEKLNMVKGLIDNIQKRFGTDIDHMKGRLEKVIKFQEKQELERISPLKLKKKES